MKKVISAILALSLVLLCGCDFFEENQFNAADKHIVKAITSNNFGLYLADDGTLYSPGYVGDANDYILFSDKKNGIVAENVRDFGRFAWGGYYIDNANDLYYFRKFGSDPLPYEPKERFKKLLGNVKSAYVTGGGIFYQDFDNNLYAAGNVCGTIFYIEEKIKLGENVICQDYDCWIEEDRVIHTSGDREYNQEMLQAANQVLASHPDVTKMMVSENCILLLTGGELWYIGDKKRLEINDFKLMDQEPVIETIKLSEDIVDFDGGACQTIAAVKNDGTGLGWGRLLMNGDDEQEQPITEYHTDAVKFNLENAVSVQVSGDEHITFITKDGQTNVFADENRFGFCGNSTENLYIGVRSTPLRWIDTDSSSTGSSYTSKSTEKPQTLSIR
ncbi:MAG: hypothetical protein IJH32_06230 [Ruminococcus sp.]|nr:hypothetical protein [Ruminococcus sp.]